MHPIPSVGMGSPRQTTRCPVLCSISPRRHSYRGLPLPDHRSTRGSGLHQLFCYLQLQLSYLHHCSCGCENECSLTKIALPVSGHADANEDALLSLSVVPLVSESHFFNRGSVGIILCYKSTKGFLIRNLCLSLAVLYDFLHRTPIRVLLGYETSKALFVANFSIVRHTFSLV